jgi:hypothetical protein
VVGALEARASQDRVVKVGIPQRRASEVCPTEVGPVESGAAQIRVVELGVAEVRVLELGRAALALPV